MLWLVVHIWALLLATFAIGVGIGWWIWGGGSAKQTPEPLSKREAPMGTLNIDYDPATDMTERRNP